MRPLRYGAVWLAAALAAAGVQADEEGRRLFKSVTPACALCHTLQDAGAEGTIGLSLDELKPDHQRVVTALRTGVGQMPAFTHLSEAQIQALARYVSQATK